METEPRDTTGKKAAPPDFDFKRIPGIVSEIEEAQAEIDQIMDAAKAKCGPIRDRIADIKKTVGKQGCPREELNAKIRERRLLTKAENCRGNLSSEQQDNFDRLSQELGDFANTGLGAAAVKH